MEDINKRITQGLEDAAKEPRNTIGEPRLLLELSRQIELLSSAVIIITSELDLETVLRRIVDLARDIAGAQYAAIRVPSAVTYTR